MPKNFDTVTDRAWNNELAALPTPNTLYFALIEEREEDTATTESFSDWTQVGSEVLSREDLTCSGRAIDCGDPLVFATVAGGLPRAVAVISDVVANDPDCWGVMNVNDGEVYDMDSYLDLAVDSLILKHSYPGET